MHGSRDLVAAAHGMLAGRLTPAAWLRSFTKPLVFAAFALDDPLPGLVELPLALWRAVTHRLPIVVRDFRRQILIADDPAGDAFTPKPDSPCSPARLRRRTSSGQAD